MVARVVVVVARVVAVARLRVAQHAPLERIQERDRQPVSNAMLEHTQPVGQNLVHFVLLEHTQQMGQKLAQGVPLEHFQHHMARVVLVRARGVPLEHILQLVPSVAQDVALERIQLEMHRVVKRALQESILLSTGRLALMRAYHVLLEHIIRIQEHHLAGCVTLECMVLQPAVLYNAVVSVVQVICAPLDL